MTKPPMLDLGLMRAFVALVEETSVTKAAVRLEQSQPAISQALGRLRLYFSDQLLVKGQRTMVPTEKAIALLPKIRALLTDIDALTQIDTGFLPASSTHAFTIASPDYIAPDFLGRIAATIRREAPNSTLSIRALGPDFDFEGALARGEVDIVIGNWPAPPQYLRKSKLLQEKVVCLMREGHPLAQKDMTEEDYLTAAHITPVSYSASHRGVVETHLGTLRASRRRTVALSYFSMAPYLLLNSDLVFSTGRHFAEHFAAYLPLVIRKPPIDFPDMSFYQLWHDRAHHSPEHRWLRGVVQGARNALSPAAPDLDR